ncbi:MAG: universal stress protein [Verrucomicrobia bacterium]|nr:universal stress protein [Verrucomicrobiota bacterium]
MATLGIRRPRNVNWLRSAAILYGDWGTSKAYVVGMAFVLAGYAGFWPVVAVCILTAIVGFNYSRVCKYYPDGGGVYSSAKAHSKWLAMIGGLLLCGDYIVTASLSCLDAFHYFGVHEPVRWAVLAIFFIGAINFFGPKHSGSIAFLLALPTLVVVVVLGVFCVPHLGTAISQIGPPRGGFGSNWVVAVGLILTLSGVETVANMTGVMETHASGPGAPTIDRTVKRTIWPVLLEVCFFTALFALAMNALPGLVVQNGHVLAPDHVTNPQHRELEASMLRYMAEIFAGNWLAWAVGLVFGFLLLSATNTAIVGLVSVIYMMAHDDELPRHFTSLNRFGVPWIPLLIATMVALLVLDGVGAIEGLAALYAIGVVGAIAVFLGSTALDFKLPMKLWERVLVGGTTLVLAAIWLTIAITKPYALLFAALVVGIGLLMTSRWVKGPASTAPFGFDTATDGIPVLEPVLPTGESATMSATGAILVAARGVTDVLKFAIEEAALRRHVLYVLYVREIAVTIPTESHWRDDKDAVEIFKATREAGAKSGVQVLPVYTTSDDPAPIILDLAATLGVEYLIMGGTQRSRIVNLLKGDVIGKVAHQLPSNIHLLIFG